MKIETIKLFDGYRVLMIENGKIVDYSDFLTLGMAESFVKKLGTLKRI